MKKFFLGVLAGIIVAVVTGVVLVFSAIKLADRKPPLPDSSVLVARLEGPIPETAPVTIPLPAFEDKAPMTLLETWQALRRAATDSRIKAVILKPRGLAVGWAKLEELHEAIENVRKAGKPVYAFLQSPGTREYYLATAADRVYLSPEDLLNVKGLRVEAMYFKGTLDKIGVQMEIEHAGKYKDAGDMMSRSDMSPETREVMNSILDDRYARIVATIAKGRKLDAVAVRTLLDDGPFLAPKAKAAKLVDELAFERDADQAIAAAVKLEVKSQIGLRQYVSSGALAPGKGAKSVAVLTAQGDILRGQAADLFGENEAITPSFIHQNVKLISEDPSISGVIVRIDSPGGDAIASDEILAELKTLSQKKPVVIAMSDLAASGGYYMAMTGDPIVARSGTLTGSIGVIYGKPNMKGLMEKLGISTETLKRGRYADIDTTSRPMTPDERAKLRESIDFIYQGFLQKVATGRRQPKETIAPLAEGRVWLGSQAKERGLVDELGGMDRALAVLRDKMKVKADTGLRLIPYPGRKSLFEQLMNRSSEQEAMSNAGIRLLIRQAGPGVAPWLDGGYLRVMPYRLDIR